MSCFTRRLAVFFLCASVGCGLSAVLKNLPYRSIDIPALQLKEAGEIQEITMEVIYDWCGGRDCPDYKIVFQRNGREDYYSSVTRVGLQSHEIKHGNLYKAEFDKLAEVLESQSFFELDSAYPQDGACADCVITKVTVLRDGRGKKVVHLYDEMPIQLWTIHRMIEGMESRVQWLRH
jgi:hypothetical protein